MEQSLKGALLEFKGVDEKTAEDIARQVETGADLTIIAFQLAKLGISLNELRQKIYQAKALPTPAESAELKAAAKSLAAKLAPQGGRALTAAEEIEVLEAAVKAGTPAEKKLAEVLLRGSKKTPAPGNQLGLTNKDKWNIPADDSWKSHLKDLRNAYDSVNPKKIKFSYTEPVDENGRRIFGTFNPLTEEITLYKGMDEFTLLEELVHWEDLPRLKKQFLANPGWDEARWNAALADPKGTDWSNIYNVSSAEGSGYYISPF